MDISPESIGPGEAGTGIHLNGGKKRLGSDMVKVEEPIDQESDSAMD
jgi:hypothetical protein